MPKYIHVREDLEQRVAGFRMLVEPPLGLGQGLGAAALDHVGHQGPGGASEPNQGNLALQLVTCHCDGIKDVLERYPNVGNDERFDVVWCGQRFVKCGPHSRFHLHQHA